MPYVPRDAIDKAVNARPDMIKMLPCSKCGSIQRSLNARHVRRFFYVTGRVCLACGWSHKNNPIKSRTKRQRIMDRDGNKCVLCGATDNLCIDHVMPQSAGGKNTDENLRVLCRSCNRTKSDTVA